MENKPERTQVRQNWNAWLFFLFMLSQIFLFSKSGLADLSYVDLKGVDEVVGDQPTLNPAYGFLQLDAALPNRRFYGNYGPKNVEFGCLEHARKIHVDLTKNNDCPQDATSEFLQRLFPSQDGINFVANQIPSDPISHLTPKAIGAVLSQIADIPEDEWGNTEKMAVFQNQLSETLFRNVNPRRYCLKSIMDWNSAVEALSTCKTAEKKEKEQAIHELYLSMKSLLDPFPNDFKMTQNGRYQKIKRPVCKDLPKGSGKKDDFNSIAKNWISALQESRLPGALYPKHLPEQALLAFFIKKSTGGKEDLIHLFEEMRSKLTDHGRTVLSGETPKQQFREDKFRERDYQPKEWQVHPNPIADRFAKEPSFLVFAVQREKLDTKELPPLLSYGTAEYGTTRYPDCGETALRNFFNILVFDDGKFNSSILTRLEHESNQVKIFEPLRKFYTDYQSPSEATSQEIRNAWSQIVGGHHEQGVNYLNGGNPHACEINAGVDNMMKLIENLVFHGVLENPLNQAVDRAAKLDALCAALSPIKKLEWEVEGSSLDDSRALLNSNNTGIIIRFAILGQPFFEWHFHANHFAIVSSTRSSQSWKDSLAATPALHSLDAPHEPILSPFINESTFYELARHRSLENMTYALPISTIDGRLFAFKQILSSPKGQAIQMKPLADRLRSRLPEEDDQYTRQQIHAALADADYPFGDPPHALGKPRIVYKRVTADDLPEGWDKTLRNSVLTKLKGAWKSPSTFFSPKGLIWMAPPVDEKGEIMHRNLPDARRYCQELGIPHARLPHFDDIRQLRKDFGGGFDRDYVPQYLRGLSKGNFWITDGRDCNAMNGLTGHFTGTCRAHLVHEILCVIDVNPPPPIPLPLEAHDPKLKGLGRFITIGPIFEAAGQIWSAIASKQMNLTDATRYCQKYEGRLPTRDEIQNLARTMPKGKIEDQNLAKDLHLNGKFWAQGGEVFEGPRRYSIGAPDSENQVLCIANEPRTD